ncbi:amidase signature enzyme [Penicillium verrucosum]|uniref:amidase signature enzyme n=1 Tax=Penicillium verrucosum TaxID=60171 RepID=UPI00254511E8|nr:amidase signature enzyme [Penicillium verrucosum]KAJ5940868.1 amidase signature enzyme [Penicillium verrucosum]
MRCATMGCNSSNLSPLSPVDLLFLDASELQTRLTERKLTSVQLVKAGLEQIRRENHQGLKLNAIISTPPEEEVIKLAEELDREREQGRVRGPLHGITIIVKDAIGNHPELKMATTSGSYALKTSVVAGDSQVIEKLRKAGVLILGKANLTEFCQMKGDNITTGWSAVGGQTTSAYIEGGIRHDQGRGGPTMPGGSSTGSAVGVSAGFSPIALGTETDGSVIQPANRAALFAIKPTHGMVSLEGAWQLSTSFDVIGPMAKSAGDLANLLNVIVKNETANYPEFLTKSFANLRLGFVDPDIWRFPDAYSHPIDGVRDQMRTAYLDAKSKIETLAKKVEYPISIVLPEDLNISGQPSISNVITYEYGPLIDSYLKNLTESEVRSLDELIKWNEAHRELELPEEYPSQSRLVAARDNVPSLENYQAIRSHLKMVTDDLSAVYDAHDIDLIVIPTDSPICSVSAATGFPIGTMPLGYLDYNGKPFGLAVMGRSGDDGLLLQFMSAFEAAFPKRRVPPPLLANLGGAPEDEPQSMI